MNDRTARRLTRLYEALAKGGTLHLSEAARLCGVSEMTIRRDVSASEGAMTFLGGRLVMTRDPQFAPLYDLNKQQDRRAQEKYRLCERAAQFIEDGDSVFIDCGTTLVALTGLLDSFEQLTVVTYALNVANAVANHPNVRLVLLGGLFHASSSSFESEDMTTAIRRLGINKAFISAAGVHWEKGVSCFHFHEVLPKQAAISSAEQRFLVVDSSKFGAIRPAIFADLDQFDVLVTSDESRQQLPLSREGIEGDGLRFVTA